MMEGARERVVMGMRVGCDRRSEAWSGGVFGWMCCVSWLFTMEMKRRCFRQFSCGLDQQNLLLQLRVTSRAYSLRFPVTLHKLSSKPMRTRSEKRCCRAICPTVHNSRLRQCSAF